MAMKRILTTSQREQLLSVDHLSEEDLKRILVFLIMIWRLLINTVERSIN